MNEWRWLAVRTTNCKYHIENKKEMGTNYHQGGICGGLSRLKDTYFRSLLECLAPLQRHSTHRKANGFLWSSLGK